MDILYLLIPFSAALVLAIIGVFAWALHRGQFDDLDVEGARILEDELPVPQPATRSPLDTDQARR
jgi:cbb3-type cytochrome oxidase maturation protein